MAGSTAIPNAAIGSVPTRKSIAGTAPGQTLFSQGGTGNNELSLANGMTAGYGVDDGHTSNPPLPTSSFNGQSINPYGGNPKWPINRVGIMRNVPGSLPSYGSSDSVFYLYFIYNPNQISAQFQMNPSQIPALYLYGGNSGTANNVTFNTPGGTNSISALASNANLSTTTVPNLTNGQIVSWSLLFDRTYDMMYDTNPDENRGVLKDTAALYNLMGTFETTGAVPISTPVQVVFGQTTSGQLWGFTGYITGVNITYGIFRHNMIPSRCEVDLSMMTTYVGSQAPPGGGGTPAVTQGQNASSYTGPPNVPGSPGNGPGFFGTTPFLTGTYASPTPPGQ